MPPKKPPNNGARPVSLIRPPSMRRAATPLPGPGGTRSKLPFEIILQILPHLPTRDLVTFAQVSRRLKDAVYEESRWISKLKLMNLWDDAAARRRWDEGQRRRRESEAARKAALPPPTSTPVATEPETLFDVVEEGERRKQHAAAAKLQQAQRGVDLLSLSLSQAPIIPTHLPPSQLLGIVKSIKSVPNHARHEFARLYAALAPFYFELVEGSHGHSDPEVFRMFRDPEEQARMLAQLKTFSECDTAMGWEERTERLKAMMGVFENAALREFEAGYEAGDIEVEGRYARVLVELNGGGAVVQVFVAKWEGMGEEEGINPLDCFDKPEMGKLSLEPSKEFFIKLAKVVVEQAEVIDKVFPAEVNVMLPFLERVGEEVVGEFVSPVIDEAHERESEMYLMAVTGLFQQALEFGMSLKPTRSYEVEAERKEGDEKKRKKKAEELFKKDVVEVMMRVFDAHVDLYLQEELEYFRKSCEAEVEKWEKQITEQDAATESFFMSNVNREADKRDFLSTFRKVILTPVNIIPSAFSSKPTRPTNFKADTSYTGATGDSSSSDPIPNPRVSTIASSRDRSSTILSTTSSTHPSRSSSPAPPQTAPSDELAAKAALMNSRLESIRSLFSLEVALTLIHLCKQSLERTSIFARLPSQTGEEAREQCEAIFITLLQILGPRHVRAGFDKSIQYLSLYDPRSIPTSTHSNPTAGVAPLVTFLDLVNVGDLIQQILDVFYETELVATKLTDPNDFLNPASKEKKHFERMLDERVAAGLNTGIDVLISEIDHIFATTQSPLDYNPPVPPATPETTPTARAVLACIHNHTSLLSGSIDKSVLEVFLSEVSLRLFSSICKHIKRQRISISGAMTLICDLSAYYDYVVKTKVRQMVPQFEALRELAGVFLIAKEDPAGIAAVITDKERWRGVWRTEEVYEFAARRGDWVEIRKAVEGKMFGFGCGVM